MVNKRYSLTEALKEDVGYSAQKGQEIIKKAEEELPRLQENAHRLFNMLSGLTIGELLLENGKNDLKKIEKALEAIEKKVDGHKSLLEDLGSDMYDIGEKELSEEARRMDGEYWQFGRNIDSLKNIIDKLDSSLLNLDDEDIKGIQTFNK